MSDHTHVINRKTGVVFGRTKQLDAHPDCMPYFPPVAAAAPAPKPVPAAPATPPKKPAGKGKKSETVSAAAAIDAAEAAIAPIEEVDFTKAVADASEE